MARRFDDVTVSKEKGSEATVQFTQRDFDPGKQHTAEAAVSGRTLTVTATIGEKKYQRAIPDVDLQEGVKVKTEKKHVFATVVKTADFKMKDKL